MAHRRPPHTVDGVTRNDDPRNELPVAGGAISGATLTRLAALTSEISRSLEANPDSAARVRYDLHAILNGWPTINEYDPTTRARIRVTLGTVTPDELTALIGEPELPGSGPAAHTRTP